MTSDVVCNATAAEAADPAIRSGDLRGVVVAVLVDLDGAQEAHVYQAPMQQGANHIQVAAEICSSAPVARLRVPGGQLGRDWVHDPDAVELAQSRRVGSLGQGDVEL